MLLVGLASLADLPSSSGAVAREDFFYTRDSGSKVDEENPLMDGSYIKEMYTHMNSAAFVLECSKGRGRLMGSFVKHTPDAGSYCGELLGPRSYGNPLHL